MPDATRALRDAFGAFATGVTVVTTMGKNGPEGITANSFASVSLSPALALWSPAKSSQRFELFSQAPHYAIHVLGEDEQELAMRFTRGGAHFEGLDYSLSPEGVPLIDCGLARFECSLFAAHDAGDHMVVIGEVLRHERHAGRPLIFSQGRFANLAL